MAQALLKVTRHYTSASAAASGTVSVTQSGTNTKTRIYADSAGASPWPSNVLALDSNGMVSFYVQARGNTALRLTLRDAQGNVLQIDDNVGPSADHIASDSATDEPPVHVLAYASTITPVASEKVTSITVGALTGALTVAAPLKPAPGKIIVFSFAQDGTGSRAITWNAVFSLAAANGAGTASQIGATAFIYTGTKWLQIGGGLTFHAP